MIRPAGLEDGCTYLDVEVFQGHIDSVLAVVRVKMDQLLICKEGMPHKVVRCRQNTCTCTTVASVCVCTCLCTLKPDEVD